MSWHRRRSLEERCEVPSLPRHWVRRGIHPVVFIFSGECEGVCRVSEGLRWLSDLLNSQETMTFKDQDRRTRRLFSKWNVLAFCRGLPASTRTFFVNSTQHINFRTLPLAKTIRHRFASIDESRGRSPFQKMSLMGKLLANKCDANRGLYTPLSSHLFLPAS